MWINDHIRFMADYALVGVLRQIWQNTPDRLVTNREKPCCRGEWTP